MPIGSRACIVSVHVYAIRLVLAIMMPGSYPRAALAAYSFHQSMGAERCKNTSLPSSMERQSEVRCGMRPTPSTFTGRILEANSSRPSRIATAVFARLTCAVNLLRSGVGGGIAGDVESDFAGALKGTTTRLLCTWVMPSSAPVRTPRARGCNDWGDCDIGTSPDPLETGGLTADASFVLFGANLRSDANRNFSR